jgi:hypothetical protein
MVNCMAFVPVILSRRSRESRSDGPAQDGEGTQDALLLLEPVSKLTGLRLKPRILRSFTVLRRFRASRSTAPAVQDDN